MSSAALYLHPTALGLTLAAVEAPDRPAVYAVYAATPSWV